MRVVLIVAGVLTVLFAVVCDAGGMPPIPIWVYALAILAVLVGILKRFTLRRMIVAVVVLAVLMRFTMVGLDSVGHQLAKVRVGMTEAEVRTIFAGYTEGTGMVSPFTNREVMVNGGLIFRNRAAEAGDSAWAEVYFTNGRVSSTRFSPD